MSDRDHPPPRSGSSRPADPEGIIKRAVSKHSEGGGFVQPAEDMWTFSRGSAIVVVRIVGEGEEACVQCLSPVMRLPEDPEAMGVLLEYNHDMAGLASFGLTNDGEIVLQAARPVRGMDANEVSAVIGAVTHFSDVYDDELLDRFGREHAIHELQEL